MSNRDSAPGSAAEASAELAALISTINTFSRRLAHRLTRREPSFKLGDWLLLKRLGGGPPTQMASVARQLGVSRQRAQKQIAELAAQGLIVARDDPHDERKKQIELTEEGRRRLRQMDGLVEAETAELPAATLALWRHQLLQLTGAKESEGEPKDK